MEPIHSVRLSLYVFEAACFWCLYFTGSESADASTQTKVILTYEVESQVLVSADACSQTDSAHTAELQMADCDLEVSSEGVLTSRLQRCVGDTCNPLPSVCDLIYLFQLPGWYRSYYSALACCSLLQSF